MIVPLVVIIMGLIDTLISYFAALLILRRLSTVPETGNFLRFAKKDDKGLLPPFTEWRLPVGVLYLFVLSIIGIYWGTTRDITLLHQVSLNVYLGTILAGLVEGMALLAYAARRFSVPKIWRIALLIVIFCSGLLTMVLAFIGLFDMYFDYRRRLG